MGWFIGDRKTEGSASFLQKRSKKPFFWRI
jgi:hypothetical protein